MGFGKLNVWIRNITCQVVDRSFHLHVYDCHYREILPFTWCYNGHAEVKVPPGCYLLQAGVNLYTGSNVYTDRVMVVIGCGEEACVNLFLPQYGLIDPVRPPVDLRAQPLRLLYCARTFLTPLILQATAAGIKRPELEMAIDIIAKAARMDKQILMDDVRAEARLLEENAQKLEGKDREELMKSISLLKG